MLVLGEWRFAMFIPLAATGTQTTTRGHPGRACENTARPKRCLAARGGSNRRSHCDRPGADLSILAVTRVASDLVCSSRKDRRGAGEDLQRTEDSECDQTKGVTHFQFPLLGGEVPLLIFQVDKPIRFDNSFADQQTRHLPLWSEFA